MALVPILLVAVGAVAGAVVAEQMMPETASDIPMGAELVPGAMPATAEGAEAGRQPNATDGEATAAAGGEADAPDGERVVVPLARHLIVPVVAERQRQAVLLFEIALDLPVDAAPLAHAAEPKLRDAFLRTMLGLAAAGTFKDGIVDPALLEQVRGILAERAAAILPVDNIAVLMPEVLKRPL